jgi:23S rRNA (cytosine1962-C5)-methyltransferase
MMNNYPVIQFKKGHSTRVRNGHPWIFSNELQATNKIPPGSIVRFHDHQGVFIGTGYYNPHSLIMGRLLSRHPDDIIDDDFFFRRIQSAIKYREMIFPGDLSYRLLYSEGDLLPGLIVDRYDDHLAVQFLTAGMEQWKESIIAILKQCLHPVCIYERSDSVMRSYEHLEPVSQLLWGTPHPFINIIQDNVRFKIDIMAGQKTGFFFDHRENRKSIQSLVSGKRVLDLFCGTGSWSLYAAQAGAVEITGIDSSQNAIDLAKQNCALNSNGDVCRFIKHDAFDAARELCEQKTSFDVVLCDPPAFAKSRQHLATAIKGYLKLNRLAALLVKPGGFLVSSSCSHHIDRKTFREILEVTSLHTGRTMRLIRSGTQALDHPILLSVPETEYLKCMTMALD